MPAFILPTDIETPLIVALGPIFRAVGEWNASGSSRLSDRLKENRNGRSKAYAEVEAYTLPNLPCSSYARNVEPWAALLVTMTIAQRFS